MFMLVLAFAFFQCCWQLAKMQKYFWPFRLKFSEVMSYCLTPSPTTIVLEDAGFNSVSLNKKRDK